MKDDGLKKIRALLINIGKTLPFVICAVVLVSYAETAFALATGDFQVYDGTLIPHKPISWFLGAYFEYNLQMLLVITIITFAIRTCIYNKLAVLYLYVNFWEKSLFSSIELYVDQVYIIVLINIFVSLFLVFKGLKMLKFS